MTVRSKARLSERRAIVVVVLAALLLSVFAAIPVSASPLTISGVAAGNMTENSAVITWTTDEVATSMVNYGTAKPPSNQAGDLTLVTNHSVTLRGLALGATYYYEVQSTNGSGNTTVTDNNGGLYYTFTTLDVTPPVITDVRAVPVSSTFATINWTTDEPASSVVNYGNTTALGLTVSDATLTTSHTVPLSGLSRGVTYFFEVQSADGLGNTATDDNNGSYYTLTIHRLTGWGWSTDYTEIANAEFVFNGTPVSRATIPEVGDLHIAGRVMLTLGNSTTETIDVDLYGTKVRSLFYSGQEEEGMSASLWGFWLTGDTEDYMSCWARISLPEGDVFETVEVYLLQLKTSDVEVPTRESGSFVDDIEYAIAVFIKFLDGLIDKLMSSNFGDIIGGILGKTMVLLSEVRKMGIPYIP